MLKSQPVPAGRLRPDRTRFSAPTAPAEGDRLTSLPMRFSAAQILVLLAWLWCAAVCAHVRMEKATTALAAAYGLMFLLLLPFSRWACFLVVVAGCAAEEVLRPWSPMRFNTLHYATFLLLPVVLLMSRRKDQLPMPLICWFGLGVWSVVTLLWSADLRNWQVWTTELFGTGALALLTRQLACTPHRRRELTTVFAFVTLAMLVAVLAAFGMKHARLGLAVGMEHKAMNPNGVGRVAGMAMLMLAISAVESRRQKLLTAGNLTAYLLLGLGVMLTLSRGSILATVAALLTLALSQPRLHHRILGLAACVILGGGVVFAAMQFDPEDVGHRWWSTFHKKDLAGATAGRSEIARTAGYVLRENWIAGVGGGQFSNAYETYSAVAHSRFKTGRMIQAHSAYLKIPAEGGLVGAILLIGFYVTLWRGTLLLPAGMRRGVARAVIIFILVSWLGSEAIEKENWIAVGLLLAWFWEHQARHGRGRQSRAVGHGPIVLEGVEQSEMARHLSPAGARSPQG
jgi:O-antigen ligase